MNDKIIYEASVYERIVEYRNFKGEMQVATLTFSLDPIALMELMAGFTPKKVKSGNPAANGQDVEITGEEQLKFIRKLAIRAAGFPSDDGESFEPFKGFENSIAGKAFLSKLVSSDGDRREFSEKVIIAPFRAFVNYAIEDPTNTDTDKKMFGSMLDQIENIFKVPEPATESLEDRRARLTAELGSLGTGE